MAVILGWSSPDPGLGPQIELLGGHTCGLLDLFGIGEALASQRVPAKKAPPALLQIEPARSRRNEDVMQTRMPFQPGARLQTIVTAEIVADQEDVSAGVVGFDIGQQSDVPLGVARSSTPGQFLAIAYS